jgi:hypothetical protein
LLSDGSISSTGRTLLVMVGETAALVTTETRDRPSMTADEQLTAQR